jgi:hypothetical protein
VIGHAVVLGDASRATEQYSPRQNRKATDVSQVTWIHCDKRRAMHQRLRRDPSADQFSARVSGLRNDLTARRGTMPWTRRRPFCFAKTAPVEATKQNAPRIREAFWTANDCDSLPAIVRERLVRFGHAVRVFLLLDRVAFALAGSDDFSGQTLWHRLLVAVA